MHDSGGGASSGSDWSGANVRQLWDLVEEQETDAHWKLVAGWRRSAELTSVHLARVENYRNNLAAAWPPDQSPAATAYLARLDEMIGNLRETNEAAVSNYTTFAAATGALSTSRSELKKLYAEYVANEDKIQQYEQAKAATAVSPTPAATPSPSPGPSPVPSQPPVTPEQQELLNWKARSVMNQLSGTLIEAKAQIKLPAPYKPPGDRTTEKEPESGGGTSPPPIPPIVAIRTDDRLQTSDFSRSKPVRQITANIKAPGVNGPSLMGTAPVITPPTTSASLTPGIGTGGPSTNTSVIGSAPFTPSGIPPSGPGANPSKPSGAAAIENRAGRTSSGLPHPGASEAARPGRPMPPGGVIGPTPSVGLGNPRSGGPAMQRVNPVGGVIGAQQPLGWGPMSAATPQTSARRPQSSQNGRSTRGPECIWHSDEGVAAVVSPRREPGRIDPGPAIGLDR